MKIGQKLDCQFGLGATGGGFGPPVFKLRKQRAAVTGIASSRGPQTRIYAFLVRS